ncbi:tripartite tricarboxylate transporter substrate-binding protein [Piscinibacter koreensis]|uniref:Twin-arginine translocation pathway signal protein n=1 Tax=Piscinibacter koreensis TaxID=2742824 RepID=A0A7Y6NRJ0_9BURK|nr:tripartite tricarboxylate transporter substrate-binding protein [Schlegelella koreensis]NUZ08008.1 twin-arginine translocation pathway signal protein [Schlegelella koreensis]
MNRRECLATVLGTLALPAVAPGARAQPAPIDKTLRIVVGFPAGGAGDTIARLLAPHLRTTYASTVLVDNRAGAGGRIGTTYVKNAEPDGMTMLLSAAPILTIYPHIYKKLPYDTLRDFVPVTSVSTFNYAFTVGPAVPASVKTLADFAAWVKGGADRQVFGSPAAGASPHFLGLMYSRAIGVDLNHIAYKGGAPLTQDLLGGQIPFAVDVAASHIPYLADGRLRILATSGRQRTVPNVPTVAEAGLPTLELDEYFGLFMPRKTPPELVARMVGAVQNAIRQPDVVAGLTKLSLPPSGPAQREFEKQVEADLQRWGPIVKSSGFVAEE